VCVCVCVYVLLDVNNKNSVALKPCSYRGKKGAFYVSNYHLKTRTTNNANGQERVVPTCSYLGKKGAPPDTCRQARKISKWPPEAKPLKITTIGGGGDARKFSQTRVLYVLYCTQVWELTPIAFMGFEQLYL
jgi:hypothetical protein